MSFRILYFSLALFFDRVQIKEIDFNIEYFIFEARTTSDKYY